MGTPWLLDPTGHCMEGDQGESRAGEPAEAAWQAQQGHCFPSPCITTDLSFWRLCPHLETVTFLARLAIPDSILRGCPIGMPLISCIISFMGPGSQGSHPFTHSARFELLLVGVYVCVCPHFYPLLCLFLFPCLTNDHDIAASPQWGRSSTLGLI